MSEYTPLTDAELLAELEPKATELFDRHMSTAKEWFPHEMVPWSRGRDYDPDEVFDPTVAGLSEGAQSALFLNILTEDNLPHYFQYINKKFGNGDVWGEWNRRWTAEEGRHAIVMRDYLAVTKSVDMRALERARMVQVSTGKVPNPPTIAEGIVYVALQEKATLISHRNTGKLLNDPVGATIMNRVGTDENLHHLFYKDLVVAAFEIDPSQMVMALTRQVRSFEMPGTGIPGYKELKDLMSLIGMFGATELLDGAIKPLVDKHCKVAALENLTPEAEKARNKLMRGIDTLGKMALVEQANREAYQAAQSS